jgi:ribosome biogenesis GTPase A
LQERAARRRADVYVVGAANVGKSTFINQVLDSHLHSRERGTKGVGSRKGLRAKSVKRGAKGNVAGARRGGVTTSPLPGTTLDMLKVVVAIACVRVWMIDAWWRVRKMDRRP